jgi:excisionase family DNA binding protein
MPALWAAHSTSEKDRKRLLRAVIADVTITSQPEGRDVAVGIRWRTGAAEQHTIQRPPSINDTTRTPPETVELITRLAPGRTNTEIAEQLNTAGLRTGKGLPFNDHAVRHIRRAHNIPATPLSHDDRLTVEQVAGRLSVSPGVIYDWISRGKLAADRDRANRLRIAFGPEIEQECRQRIVNSSHISQTRIAATGGAV